MTALNARGKAGVIFAVVLTALLPPFILPRVASASTFFQLAYVTNAGSGTVTPVNVTTGVAGSLITVGVNPYEVAFTPDGTKAYVTNYGSNTVTPITVSTNTPGTPITVGTGPIGVAFTPDGTKAYVANYGSNTVTPITVSTNTPGTPITVGTGPSGVAITPDGTKAYVADKGSPFVTPITVSTNTPGTAIFVGANPEHVAFTPDGTKAYVTNSGSNTVTPITVSTNTPGTAITVGTTPWGVAFSPDGTKAYVTNSGSNTVTPITVSTNTPGTAITVGTTPYGVAFTPDGTKAYVAIDSSTTVTPITVSTNTPGTAISLGSVSSPSGVAMAPYQAPAITSANSTTFTAGQAGSFTVTTTGTPPPTVTKSGTLPTGVTFVDNGDGTATLSGTTSATGTYPLTITAHNATTPDAVQTFTLTVPGWYNTSWLYRKPITIDHTKVGASLTNFPYLVNITDAALAAKAQSSGNDILFTPSDGVTKLNHQIESYTSGTGALVAWVNVPALSTTADTIVYLYYGNASATNQQNATAVWDANFVGVWHLSEAVSATAGAFKDSTSNANNATYQGSPGMTQGAGQFGGSLTLDGTDDYLSTTNQLTVPTNVTLEAWFKTTTASGKKIVGFQEFQTGTASNNYDRMIWVGTDGLLRFNMFDTTYRIVNSSTAPTNGAWHQAVAVEDNTAHTLTLYLDGVATTIATGTTPQSYTGWWRIGAYDGNVSWTNSVNGYFPGSIGEVRVANTVRSAGWITTEYKNQSSPSTFSTVGTEQGLPTITSANNTTFTVGSAGTFTVTTTGAPTPTVAETGALPTGVTFVDNGNGTATLAGTAGLTGTYSLTITAHNTAGPDATQSFTLTIAAGTLSIAAPSTANLGSVVLGTTISSQLGSVQVIDNRGSATAAWTATVSSTTFTLTGHTVPLANLKYWSGPSTATTGTGTFTPGQATAGAAQDLTTSRITFTLTGGNGANTATWNPTLSVTVPVTVVPGTYTATVTHSVS